MSDLDKYTIQDLISNASEQQPIEFENTFNSLLLDRIRGAVEDRKQEIAASMFNNVEVGEPEEE